MGDHKGIENREVVLMVTSLQECVSTRAKRAIGIEAHDGNSSLDLQEGDGTDMVLYGLPQNGDLKKTWRVRSTVQEIIYDAGPHRTTIKNGCCVSRQ